MYILKNAWVSITRNKGRNILIGIIILVISCTTAVTLAIKNSSDELIDSYASKYDVTATISVNRENLMKDFDPRNSSGREEMLEKFSDISTVEVSDIEKFGNSDLVKSYYYTTSVGVNSSDLDAASMTFNNDSKNDNENKNFQMPNDIPDRKGGMGGFNNQTSGDFTLTGYSSYEAMTEFISGSYTITSGEVSDDFEGNNCVINSELATLNEIEVGDTITVVDPENEDLTYKLKVTGIYEEKTSEENKSAMSMSMFSNSVNNIITNVNVVNKLKNKNSDLVITTTPTFVLKSKDVIEEFSKELTEKGLDENLTVTTNLETISSATTSISNVSTFSMTFLIITLIIGAIVLFVINMINIRERKYEIGVLRTIGMKKSLLTLQFILELSIVSLFALIVGLGIGSCISVPVSNSLLESEISSSKQESLEVQKGFGRGEMRDFEKVNGVAAIQAYDSINAVVDFKVIIELLAIGIGLTLISGTASMISIQKFSPLTILKERS